jgi:hypothetical protein
MGMSLAGLGSMLVGYDDQSQKDRDWNISNAEKQIGLAQAQRAENDIKTERQTYANSSTAKAQQAYQGRTAEQGNPPQGGNGANSIIASPSNNPSAVIPDHILPDTAIPTGLQAVAPGVSQVVQQAASGGTPSAEQQQGLSATQVGVAPAIQQAEQGQGDSGLQSTQAPVGKPVQPDQSAAIGIPNVQQPQDTTQQVQTAPVVQSNISHAPNAAPPLPFGTQAQMDSLDRQLSVATKMRDSAQQNGDIAGGQKWQDTIGNIIQSRKNMDYHNAAAPLLSGDPGGFQNYYNKWVNPSNPIVSIQKTPDGKFVGTFQDGTQNPQPLSTDQLGTILTHQHYLEDNRTAIQERDKAQAAAQGKITEANGTSEQAKNAAQALEAEQHGMYWNQQNANMQGGTGRWGDSALKNEKDPDVIKDTKFLAANLAAQNQKAQPGSDLTANDFMIQAYNQVKGGSNSKISLPEQRSNAEIDAARTAVSGLSQDEIKSRSTKNTPTGRANPNYDPNMARQLKLAQTRKIGTDDTFDQQNGIASGTGQTSATGNNAVTGTDNQTYLGGMPISKYTDDQLQRSYNVASPPAQAKIEAELTNRSFTKDATMAGNKLGSQTPKGYQVLDKTGKLIGYYKR